MVEWQLHVSVFWQNFGCNKTLYLAGILAFTDPAIPLLDENAYIFTMILTAHLREKSCIHIRIL